MQNTILKFRQSAVAFEKPGIWSKNLKTLTSLQFNSFCLNFGHFFYLPLSTKLCVDIFLFCLDLEIFAKTKKDLASTHSFFTLILITRDLNKIKKFHKTFCRHC